MTDGASGDDARPMLPEIKREFPALQAHFIFFNNSGAAAGSAAERTLQAMAQDVGGQMMPAGGAVRLEAAFASIAREVSYQ